MKKKKHIIIAIVVIALITSVFVYNYVFNSKHRDIANENASITIKASEILVDFQKNESSATQKYLDKVIEVTGVVSEVEENTIVLNEAVALGFIEGTMPKVNIDKPLKVKGRCVGYDELLEIVKIDQASIQ